MELAADETLADVDADRAASLAADDDEAALPRTESVRKSECRLLACVDVGLVMLCCCEGEDGEDGRELVAF